MPSFDKEKIDAALLQAAQEGMLYRGEFWFGKWTESCEGGCLIGHAYNTLIGPRWKGFNAAATTIERKTQIPWRLLSAAEYAYERFDTLDEANKWAREFFAAMPMNVDLSEFSLTNNGLLDEFPTYSINKAVDVPAARVREAVLAFYAAQAGVEYG